MIAKKGKFCQEKKIKRRNNLHGKNSTYSNVKCEKGSNWGTEDQEIISWFFSYLQKNPGTYKNPLYDKLIKKIQQRKALRNELKKVNEALRVLKRSEGQKRG